MGFFDGVFKVASGLPFVGHVIAGVQFAIGDTDAAQKTVAASTGNLVSTLGAVGGFMVGGPPGAVAGGSLGNLVGGQIENAIKGDGLDLSVGKVGSDLVIGGLTGGLGGGSLNSVAKSAADVLNKEVISKTIAQVIEGSLAKTALAQTGGQIVQTVVSQVRADGSTDYDSLPTTEKSEL